MPINQFYAKFVIKYPVSQQIMFDSIEDAGSINHYIDSKADYAKKTMKLKSLSSFTTSLNTLFVAFPFFVWPIKQMSAFNL